MRSEKGLTLISTIFLVLIIALLVFGVIYFVRIEKNKELTEDAKTNMLLVQAKVRKISSEYLLDKKEDNLKGTKISEMQENEVIKQFLEKELFDIKEKNKNYYVLNQKDLNDLELKITLKDDSYYIVEYTSNNVYYTKGYIDENGNTIYSLSEMEENRTENVEK